MTFTDEVYIRLLNPDNSNTPLWLTLAYRWVKDRPWAYPDTGGKQSLEEFITELSSHRNFSFGIFEGRYNTSHENDSLISLMILEALDDVVWRAHIISPKKSKLAQICEGAKRVMDLLFTHTLLVDVIKTTVPTFYGKHKHRGSCQICTSLGFMSTEIIFTDENEHSWQQYEITRKAWEDTTGQKSNVEH